MANSTTTQIIMDGEKNVVVKFEGVIDTSDLAATGTLGAGASGVTTINSPIITFTAGGLAPVRGQLVTGTGIPAKAYIVSVDSTTQVTLNTNATASGTGLTFTLVAGAIVVADPAILADIDPRTGTKASKLRLDKVTYSIEDLLSVNLFWDATAAVRIEELIGRGKMDHKRNFGGLINNAGTGINGRITATTQGWSASAVLSFSLVLEFTKQL